MARRLSTRYEALIAPQEARDDQRDRRAERPELKIEGISARAQGHRVAEKVAQQPDDLPAAFLAYQQQRYLRTARVQIMARVYGEFFHARGPTAELRDQMLGARPPQQAYESIDWLYGVM